MNFRYRILMIITMFWIALSLNIERPDSLIVLGNININSFVYVLGLAAIFVLIVFFNVATISLRYIVPSITIFYILGKVVTYDENIDPALLTTITLVEISLLVGSIWIAKQLSSSINQFNIVTENELISREQSSILQSAEGEQTIRNKIERARRFERKIALVYVTFNAINDRTRRQWDQEEKVRYMYLKLQVSELMSFLLDFTDTTMWHNDNLVVCLDENDKEAATNQAILIQQVLHDVMGIDSTIGVSIFPEDGLLYQDMLRVSMQTQIVQ